MIDINGHKYRELRCKECRKLIMFEDFMAGKAAFSCPRCGAVSEFSFKFMNTKSMRVKLIEEYSLRKGGEVKNGRHHKRSARSL